MIDKTGNLKLVDFGYAKVLDKLKTFTVCGTESYMSPEIILG